MVALVLEYLHIFQFVVLLQFIEFVVIFLQQSEKLSVVFFCLLHVYIPSGQGFLKQFYLGVQILGFDIVLDCTVFMLLVKLQQLSLDLVASISLGYLSHK